MSKTCILYKYKMHALLYNSGDVKVMKIYNSRAIEIEMYVYT